MPWGLTLRAGRKEVPYRASGGGPLRRILSVARRIAARGVLQTRSSKPELGLYRGAKHEGCTTHPDRAGRRCHQRGRLGRIKRSRIRIKRSRSGLVQPAVSVGHHPPLGPAPRDYYLAGGEASACAASSCDNMITL